MASQAEIDLIVDASRTLPQLERDLDRVLAAAQAGADEIDVHAAVDLSANLATLEGELTRLVNSAGDDADDIDLIAVINQRNTLSGLRRDLDRVVATAEGDVDPVAIRGVIDGARTLRDVNRELDRVVSAAQAAAPDVTVDVDVDEESSRSLRDLIPTFDRVGSSAASSARSVGRFSLILAGVSAGAAAAVPAVVGVATALEQVAPASAVATQGMLAMQLVSGTLKVGMIGLEEAVTAAFDPDAKPEDLAKAMERLAPEARAFVEQLTDMRDGFNDLRLGVQDRLFQNTAATLRELSNAVLPQVQTALNRTAVSLNTMGQGAAAAAINLADTGVLGRALDSATKGIENLSEVPAQAVTAFGQLAAAAGPAFERITRAASGAATSVSESLAEAFESGRLELSIDAAVDSIAQLGRIGANVFEVLGNVISVVDENGAGLFATLESLSRAFADVTASQGFQDALGALVTTLTFASQTVMPLFAQALRIIGPVIEALAPPARELVAVLGQSLTRILDELGPVLETLAVAFGQLVIDLLPFVSLAGDLVVAILPALTPLFQALGDVLREAEPLIRQIAENLGAQLVPVLESIAPVMEQILPQFARMAEELFPQLTELLADLAPHFIDLSEQVAELVVQAAPLIVKLLELSGAIAGRLLPVIGPVLVGAIIAVTKVLGALTAVVTGVVIPAVNFLISNLRNFRTAMEQTGTVISNITQRMARAFGSFRDNVSRILSSFVSGVGSAARNAADRFSDGIQRMISRARNLIGDLPGIIRGAAGGLGNVLFSAGSSVISGFIRGIQSQIGRLVSTLGGITDRLPDWKGPEDVDENVLFKSGQLVMQGFQRGIESQVGLLKSQLGAITGTLPGMAAAGIGSVPAPASRDVQPVVLVRIGNEAIDRFVTVRTEQISASLARTAAQGVRF